MVGSASYARQHTGSRKIARKLQVHISRLKCGAGGRFQAGYSLTPPLTEMVFGIECGHKQLADSRCVCSHITGMYAASGRTGRPDNLTPLELRLGLPRCVRHPSCMDIHRFGLDSRSADLLGLHLRLHGLK